MHDDTYRIHPDTPGQRLRPGAARVLFLCTAALALGASGATAAAPPPAGSPIPGQAVALARSLSTVSAQLHVEIRRWTPKSGPAPSSVQRLALYEQRVYRLLARDERLARLTLPRLPRALAAVSRDFLAAQRELYRLTPPIAAHRVRVGPARPAGDLLGYYREAQSRYHVAWNVLAAVNFVESKFGKLRSASAAGAQGPMQFMPATWRRYGLGGDVHDARDAILGAANYLHASGASRNLRRALYSYNPSRAYVDAVLRYTRRIGADRAVFFDLYNWQVFVKTPRGDRRVTGPGLP